MGPEPKSSTSLHHNPVVTRSPHICLCSPVDSRRLPCRIRVSWGSASLLLYSQVGPHTSSRLLPLIPAWTLSPHHKPERPNFRSILQLLQCIMGPVPLITPVVLHSLPKPRTTLWLYRSQVELSFMTPSRTWDMLHHHLGITRHHHTGLNTSDIFRVMTLHQRIVYPRQAVIGNPHDITNPPKPDGHPGPASHPEVVLHL